MISRAIRWIRERAAALHDWLEPPPRRFNHASRSSGAGATPPEEADPVFVDPFPENFSEVMRRLRAAEVRVVKVGFPRGLELDL